MKTCPNCKELVGDSASKCFNCGWSFDNPSDNQKVIEKEKLRREQEAELNKKKEEWAEQDRIKKENAKKEVQRQAQYQAQYIDNINNKYEYKVFSVYDNRDGSCNTTEIERLLTVYAVKGWRLKTIFSNELGKNAISIGGSGTNSTVDQTVIVLERLVSKAKE